MSSGIKISLASYLQYFEQKSSEQFKLGMDHMTILLLRHKLIFTRLNYQKNIHETPQEQEEYWAELAGLPQIYH